MRKLYLKYCFFLFAFSFYLKSKAQINYQWVKAITGAYDQRVSSVATDKNGFIYVTGFMLATADFDPSSGVASITSAGSQDDYVAKYDSLGNYIWAITFPGPAADWSHYVMIDSLSNVYVTGTIQGTNDFDPGPGIANLTSVGSDDIFIAKYDQNANYLWAIRMGGSSFEKATGLAVDDSLNVYVSGTFRSTVDFDPGPGVFNISSHGQDDIFLAKYKPNGDLMWAHGFGDPNGDWGNAVCVGSDNSVYMAGNFNGSVDFNPLGAGTLIAYGGDDAFIAKYDHNGIYQWAKKIGGLSNERVDKMTLDKYNNIHVTGIFSGTIDCDPSAGSASFSSKGITDFFVAKYSSSGIYQWAQTAGSTDYEFVYGIGVDNTGNVFVGGEFHDVVDFDPSPSLTYSLTPIGYLDPFVAKYDVSGNFIAAKSISGTEDEDCMGLATTINNEIIMVGHFSDGSADFDPAVSTSVILNSIDTKTDIYILKLSSLQGACSNLKIAFDTVSNALCSTQGYASAVPSGGTEPYLVSWNTVPVTIDTSVYFSYKGIYTVFLTDSIGCSVETSLLINGPDSISSFDLDVHAVISPPYHIFSNSTVYFVPKNQTCNLVNATVTIISSDPRIHIDSVGIPTSYASGDTLQWIFPSLLYDSLPVIPLYTKNLTALIGDTICFDVILTPITGDYDTTNNIKQLCTIVMGPFDPNIKEVSPMGIGPQHSILNNQKSTYTVHFQNTGSAEAINVYVLDTISPFLDLSTVNVIYSSDYMYTEVLPGNILKFKFDNIHLPDSTSDEPNSHGFFMYEIDQLPNLPHGTIIENTAAIYFDYNAPVITNTVFNTIDLSLIATALNNPVCSGDSTLLTVVPNVPGLQGNWQWYANVCSGTVIGMGTTIWVNPGATTTYFVKDSAASVCYSTIVTALPSSSSSQNSTICPGDTLTFGTQQLFTTGTYNETFNNVYGCDSIVTLTLDFFIPDDITQNISICSGDTMTFGTQQLFAPGTYTETFANMNGCDSIVNLTLSFSPVDVTVAPSSITLSANASPATYQWLDCNAAYAALSGETNQNFTATVNGNYAVIVTEGGCSDTSACYLINGVGMNSFSENGLSVYPNPVSDELNVVFKSPISNASIQLLSITGQLVFESKIMNSNSAIIQTKDLESGIYYLQIKNGNEMFNLKIVKE